MYWLEMAAWVGVFVWGLMIFPVAYGILFPRYLRDVLPHEGDDLPFLSIIVPARDEAAAIEEALRRLLNLNYPHYEVIAVDDRSTDGTGDIMDRVASEVGGRLQVVHLSELPDGWLGKTHAMATGVERSRGEYLLLTDGDVMLDPLTLRRAMSVVLARKLDHLVLLPVTTTTTFLETALMNLFCMMIMASSQFPLVRWKRFKDAYLGVGAFNLLRRSAYDQVGGFDTLRLEVADDMMLGRLIKHHGLNQDVYGGQGSIQVRWQSGGVWSIVRGLEKNAFSGTGYSITRTLAATTLLCLLFVAPVILLICGIGNWPLWILAVGNLILSIGTAWTVGYPLAVGLFYPWAMLVFAYIMLRSMAVTLRQGGIRWRDTFYSLKSLRAARQQSQITMPARSGNKSI